MNIRNAYVGHYSPHNGINMSNESPSPITVAQKYIVSPFLCASRPSALANFDLSEILRRSRRSCTSHPPSIYGDVVSSPILGPFCLPDFFFPPLASTIHPRALIEARTAGAEYRGGKKSRRFVGRRSLHASHDRYAMAVS